MLRPAGPGQICRVYGDLCYHGITTARFHRYRSSFILWFSGGAFSRAHHPIDIKIIHKNVGNVNFFCEKIAKNVKTGAILANFSFFVKFFAGKSGKVSNSREKLPKMVESDLILAKCAFFVNVSPFVG